MGKFYLFTVFLYVLGGYGYVIILIKVNILVYIKYMIKLILPLYVEIPRKTMKPRKISLSRNVWDSTHHAVKTQVKHILQDIINEQLSDYSTPLKSPISITMNYYANRTDSDLGNFCDVLKKIAQDAVVRHELIDDDNVEFITEEHAYYKGKDKKNPRIEITWSEIKNDGMD